MFLLSFSGNNYNIPLTIVLPSNYPSSPPMLTVKPTANMSIAPNHPNLDPNGNVRHEYLTDWKVALPINNLLHMFLHITQHKMLSFLFSFSRAATSRLSCRSFDSCSLRRLLYTPIDNRLHLRLSHTHSRPRAVLSRVCPPLFFFHSLLIWDWIPRLLFKLVWTMVFAAYFTDIWSTKHQLYIIFTVIILVRIYIITAAAYPYPSNYQYQQQPQPPYPGGGVSSAGAWGSRAPYPPSVPVANTPGYPPQPPTSSQFPTPFNPLPPLPAQSQGSLPYPTQPSSLSYPMSMSMSGPTSAAPVVSSYSASREASQVSSFSAPLGQQHQQQVGGGFGHASSGSSSAVNKVGTITGDHIRASLVSAILDRARRRVNDKVNGLQACRCLRRGHSLCSMCTRLGCVFVCVYGLRVGVSSNPMLSLGEWTRTCIHKSGKERDDYNHG